MSNTAPVKNRVPKILIVGGGYAGSEHMLTRVARTQKPNISANPHRASRLSVSSSPRARQFEEVPGAPLVFRISAAMRKAFHAGQPSIKVADARVGLQTGDNDLFLRLWFEVSGDRLGRGLTREEAATSPFRWFPYNKGGEYRKWYGNQDWVVNWQNDGAELFAERPKAVIRSPTDVLPALGVVVEGWHWDTSLSGDFPETFLFDVAGTSIFADEDRLLQIAAVCNSNVVRQMLAAISPTLNVEVGTISQLPIVDVSTAVTAAVRELIEIHRGDWNDQETSWDFSTLNLIATRASTVRGAVGALLESGRLLADRVRGPKPR